MRPVLALAVLELRRFLADRFSLFFVFVLPLVLVGVLGLQASSQSAPHVALTGTAADQLTPRLEAQGMVVTAYPDRGEVDRAVAAGAADLGVVAKQGKAGPSLELLAVDGQPHPALGPLVQAAAQEEAVAQGHTAALVAAGVDQATARRATAERPEGWARAGVAADASDSGREELAASGRFDGAASSQLVVFVFLNTLTAAAATIQARRSGALRRVLSAPVTSAQTVGGLALGRLVIALFQGAYVMAASSLLFGVTWGDLPSVLLVLTAFGLVAAGIALILGVVMDAEGPASGVAVGGGLILAALGGAMVPLQLFPDTLRAVARVTPHAWAIEAITRVQGGGGGVLDILPQLGVLLGMALLVLGVGALLLRRSLARAV